MSFAADALEERERPRPGHRDLAERAQVDDPDALPDRPVLLPHPIEPVRPCPAALPWHPPVARPRLAGAMEVRALPARLRAEHGARGLETRRAARTGAAAVPRLRRRTGSAGGSSRRRSRERGPPRTRDRGTCPRTATPGTARCRRRDRPSVIQPATARPMPPPPPNPLSDSPAATQNPRTPGIGPMSGFASGVIASGMADEPHRLRIGEEREAPDRALHERLEPVPVGRHGRRRVLPRHALEPARVRLRSRSRRTASRRARPCHTRGCRGRGSTGMSFGSSWPGTAFSATCWWSTGVDGMNAPTISATRGAHRPAAFTTSSVSIGSPSSTRTRRISRRGPSSNPVTRVFCRIRTPSFRGRVREGDTSRCAGRGSRRRAGTRAPYSDSGEIAGQEPPRLLGGDDLDVEAHAARPARRPLELLELLRRRRQPDAAHRARTRRAARTARSSSGARRASSTTG